MEITKKTVLAGFIRFHYKDADGLQGILDVDALLFDACGMPFVEKQIDFQIRQSKKKLNNR